MKFESKTFKNKIIALSLIGAGYMSTLIDDDGTFFVIALILGVPLFFSKENWIY